MTTRATIDTTEDPPEDPDAPDDQGGAEPTAEDRPEWLPEKFDSPEQMAESYSELESKLGQGNDPEPEPDDDGQPEEDLEPEDLEIDQEVQDSDELDFQEINNELRENGELSDETYEKFNERGIPNNVVDNYVSGLQARAREATRRMSEVAGGQDSLENVLDWAAQNLSEEQIESYNGNLQQGDMAQAELALRGIVQQYQESEGVEPDLTSGEGAPRSRGVEPYSSRQEMVQDMRSDKYKRSPEFRQEVEERLSVTDAF